MCLLRDDGAWAAAAGRRSRADGPDEPARTRDSDRRAGAAGSADRAGNCNGRLLDGPAAVGYRKERAMKVNHYQQVAQQPVEMEGSHGCQVRWLLGERDGT